MQNNPPKQPYNLPADFLDRNNLRCPCGNEYFLPKTVFKKLSIVESPTGMPNVIALQVNVCEKCGMVASEKTLIQPL
jgi:hypothetical protein